MSLTLALALAAAPIFDGVVAQQGGPVQSVGTVDLERYAGRWYEIARIPNRFQKDCASDVTADYSVRDDGRIDVENRCVRADGVVDRAAGLARTREDDATRARLEVSFLPAWLRWLPMGWADYWIVELDPDYRFAVVGSPDRRYLWILSRTPTLEAETYAVIVERLLANNYPVAMLVRTPQGGTGDAHARAVQ
ncbi:MAG: lipocalin family protein [Burkholderiales bacterium]|nr:lipocalin family protein [Burkholderiales bacterium]